MLPPALVDLLHLPPEASSAAPDIDALHAVADRIEAYRG